MKTRTTSDALTDLLTTEQVMEILSDLNAWRARQPQSFAPTFLVDAVRRSRRENEWKRRWREER